MNDYPLITMRLLDIHKSSELLDEYLALIGRHRGACDELWFSTEYGFPPLEVHETNANMVAVAAERAREVGITVSLQISNTIGHGSYLQYLDFTGVTWQRMVGPDGVVAPCSNCPRDPEFLSYLDAAARLYCTWRPASVWVDDDFRMHHHHPVANGCFCDRCIADFSEQKGVRWRREELVTAINAGPDTTVRQAWVDFGRQSLAHAAEVIAHAVVSVSPDSRMGLEHCDHTWSLYNGPDWAHILETMGEVSGRPVGSRPGGGFYIDHSPREMLRKAIYIGLQNSRLPDCVDDSRAEVENLPGAVTGKSARGTVLESTLALAYGCNALTYTHLMFTHEETAWHEQMLSEIAGWRPGWSAWIEASRDTEPSGLQIVYSRRQGRREAKPWDQPFAWGTCDLGNIPMLPTIGLPLCWNRESATGAILYPSAADGLNEAELREVLGRGVITDGETIHRLQERGFGELLPVRAVQAPISDVCQKLTDDPLNGPYAERPITLSGLYRTFPAYSVHTEGSGRMLSHFTRADGTVTDPSTMAVETSEGGRLVVFGNGCWESTVTTAQRAQLLAAADWVSLGGLPAVLETPCQVVVIPRVDSGGQLRSVILLNCSLDPTPRLQMRLRNPRSTEARWFQFPDEGRSIESSPSGMSDVSVTIPSLGPWDAGALLLGQESG